MTGAPTFDLELDGQTLGASQLRYVVTMELAESLDKLDAMTVQLAIPERDGDVLPLARHLAPFKVRLGYGGETIRQVEGEILEVGHSRSPKGPWLVTLRGLDRLHRLKKTTRSTVWTVSHSA